MSDTRQAIVAAARSLFSERGYSGASVRDICRRAGTSSNAINYHFGTKERLYEEILRGLASAQLELAERVLSSTLESSDEFVVRLELFFSQLLDVYLENRETFRIIAREFEQLLPRCDDSVMGRFIETNHVISDFVRRAMECGFVAHDIDADIVAGLLLDRTLNQARFTDAHKRHFDVSTLEEEYRGHWVRANLRIVFHGICASDESSA